MRAVAVYRYAEYVRDDDPNSFDPLLLAFGLAMDRAFLLVVRGVGVDEALEMFRRVLIEQLEYMGWSGDVGHVVERGRELLVKLSELGIRGRRPRPRLVAINGDAGFYAQPDLVTGELVLELKAEDPPPPKHTMVQVLAYSLAFPELRPAVLMTPIGGQPTLVTLSPKPQELCRLLARMREFALRHGTETRDRPAITYRVEYDGDCRYWGPYRASAYPRH